MSARKLVFAALAVRLAVPLLAGPILTTIQDVIYNADGTPYNGFAVIKWTPFVAGDTSQIATQSVTVNITGGNLMVQLVPTTNATPAGYYTVTFTSAGNDQFTEMWAVPPSVPSLRVQAVVVSQATSQNDSHLAIDATADGVMVILAHQRRERRFLIGLLLMLVIFAALRVFALMRPVPPVPPPPTRQPSQIHPTADQSHQQPLREC